MFLQVKRKEVYALEKVTIDDIEVDPNYKNEEVERREREAREKYFQVNGRWPEEDNIIIKIVI